MHQQYRELYLRELEADERNVVHSVSLRRGAVGGDGNEGVEERKRDVDAVDALPRGGVRVWPSHRRLAPSVYSK